ncbi:MAG: antitoxin component YwqK of YwqJK toxin-antitoxin module [Candidatus Paceibacteria bacterium]|jgi:antitoxin component YwqK of YwqJK toxin-antitoxin module
MTNPHPVHLMSGLAILLMSAACGSTPPRSGIGPAVQPEVSAQDLDYRRLRQVDPETGTLVHSWSIVVYPDGHTLKQGKEQRWYPSGARLSEANFHEGELVGEFRRWHANGQLLASSTLDAGRLCPMKFWHADGTLSAEGLSRQGTREGYWRFWYESGDLREEGGFVSGQRSGLWSLFHEDGSLEATGRFQDGQRVGPWQHFELGQRR